MHDSVIIRRLNPDGPETLRRIADPRCLDEVLPDSDESTAAAFVRGVRALSEAFTDYPAIRYIIGTGWGDADARLARLVHFFCMARVYRDEPVVLAENEDGVAGVALISWVEERDDNEALRQLRAALWRMLGEAARTRYGVFGETLDAFTTDEPQIHLNMIGVSNAARGCGVGRALLDYVHAFSAARPGSSGVSLNTESPENVALYRHFGYEVVAQARVSPDLMSWGMFRPNTA